MVTTRSARAVKRVRFAMHQASASVIGTPSASGTRIPSSSPTGTPSASASNSSSFSPAVPEQVVCPHTVSCVCGSDFRPTDPSVYFNARRNRSNNVTEKYLLDNLGLEPAELKFLLGSSMAFGCGLRSSALRVYRCAARFRIKYSDPAVVGSPLEAIVGRLRKEFIILSGPAITEHELRDHFSRADDGEASIWTPTDLDLTVSVYDGRNATSRAFVCLYVVPTLLRIIQLSEGELEKALYTKIAAVPAQRRHYFAYLAVKAGLGTVSAAKKREWSNFLLSRKVDAILRCQAVLPVAEVVELNPVRARLEEQDGKITEMEARHNEEMKALNERLNAHTGVVNGGSQRQADDGVELLEGITARQDEHIRGQFEAHRNAQDKSFHALRDELMAGQKSHGKEIQDIRVAHDNQIQDVRKRQDDQATDIENVTKRQDEQAKRQDDQGQELLTTRKDFATSVDNSIARHSEVMMTRMEQLLSVSNRPAQDVPAEATVLPIDFPTHCTVQLYLRVRNPSAEAENAVDAASAVLHRAFVAGEPTDVVVRAVTRGLSSSVPFIIALLGYSGGGKTFTFGQLLDTVLGYLPDVEVMVLEVLNTRTYLNSYSNKQGLAEEINKLRKQRPTPANMVSSRAHLVVTFEAVNSDRKYGMLLDIAGDEESEDRAQLQPEERLVSAEIAKNNSDFRSLVHDLMADAAGQKVSMFKRSSKLNSEVSGYLGHCKRQPPVIKLLYCADGNRADIVAKTLQMMPEI